MTIAVRRVVLALLASASTFTFAQNAGRPADADDDALSLSSAPVETASKPPSTRFFVEGALGAGEPRDGSSWRTLRRASFDLTHAVSIAPGWRGVISDRLDYARPADFGNDPAVNTLREAYVTWQPSGGETVVDVGRVNLRYGPGYGYNPTDFFRDYALRSVTSLDPFSLRENRMGTVLVRGQRLWSAGSVSLAYSPKVADRPSSHGESLDLGATNNRDRGVLAFSSGLSSRVSGQVLVYKESGRQVQIGASLTALASDALVGHVEWSRGRELDTVSRALGVAAPEATRNRLAAGLTYTTAGKLSLTAEYEYNGFAPAPRDIDALGRTAPAAYGAYILDSLRRQDLASRKAWLVYATQKGFGLRALDLTALLRVSAGDHSRLAWLELRHHWTRFDLALRLQQQNGRDLSEYGLVPDRRSAQLVGSYFF